MRIKTTQIIFAILFLSLALGLFYIQVLKAPRYTQLSQANRIRIIPQPGSRGKIIDRKAKVIADNYLSYDIAILPSETKDIDEALEKLADIVDVSFQVIRSRYKRDLIANSLPVTLLDNIERKKAVMVEELKSDLPGIFLQVVPKRFYPHQRLAAHLLGYLGEIDHWRLTKLKDYGYKTKDLVGYTGIEEKYDYYLRPQEGGLQVEVDHRNRIVRILGFRPASNGKDIQLTIDLEIQKIAEESLGSRTGAVIILEPNTGEVLAVANFPNFHPDWFIKKSPQLSKILNERGAPLLNRCISGVYPPGSIFKMVVATAALEEKRIDTKKKFYCSESIKIGNRKFGCWEKHGSQNLIEAIKHSCNVFFYRTGLLLGGRRLSEYASKFGLGRLTQIDLPQEDPGFVPSPLRRRLNRFQSWFDGDTVNFSIGQGELLVTPLQIARITAVFANRGKLVRPYLVKSIDGQDVSGHQEKIIPLSFKQRSLDIVREGMRQAVEDIDGTASIIKSSVVSVAGKTGTAQVTNRQSHAWFSGYFPIDKPKFVICVVLEYAGSSLNACIVARDIIKRMIQEGLL
jgi:penicillin-binding protein 2